MDAIFQHAQQVAGLGEALCIIIAAIAGAWAAVRHGDAQKAGQVQAAATAAVGAVEQLRKGPLASATPGELKSIAVDKLVALVPGLDKAVGAQALDTLIESSVNVLPSAVKACRDAAGKFAKKGG